MEKLVCTAVSKPDDITGTMTHYPHMEERHKWTNKAAPKIL